VSFGLSKGPGLNRLCLLQYKTKSNCLMCIMQFGDRDRSYINVEHSWYTCNNSQILSVTPYLGNRKQNTKASGVTEPSIPMLSPYGNVKLEESILYFKQQNWLGVLAKNILLWRLWCTTDTYNSALVSFPGLQCTHPPLCSLVCNDNNKHSSTSAYHYQCKLKNK